MGMVSEDIEAQTMISSVEDTPKAVKVSSSKLPGCEKLHDNFLVAVPFNFRLRDVLR